MLKWIVVFSFLISVISWIITYIKIRKGKKVEGLVMFSTAVTLLFLVTAFAWGIKTFISIQ